MRSMGGLAILEPLRQDWRATTGVGKVIILIAAAVVVAWAIFTIWFWVGFQF